MSNEKHQLEMPSLAEFIETNHLDPTKMPMIDFMIENHHAESYTDNNGMAVRTGIVGRTGRFTVNLDNPDAFITRQEDHP